jgi:hypothetical protein
VRLTRTVDLTGVTAAQTPRLEFALSYDVETGYDNVIIGAHPVGTDAWTTLPEVGGLSDGGPPAECEVGFLLERHPFLSQRTRLRGDRRRIVMLLGEPPTSPGPRTPQGLSLGPPAMCVCTESPLGHSLAPVFLQAWRARGASVSGRF